MGIRDEIFQDFLTAIELPSIENIALVNNNVLVEVAEFMHSEIKGFAVCDIWTPHEYVMRTGVLARLPSKIVDFTHPSANGLDYTEWTTPEFKKLRAGDKVWFYGMSSHSSTKLKVKNKLFIIINYADLYVAKDKEGNVLMLNDNVLIRQIEHEVKALSYMTKNMDTKFGEVAYKPDEQCVYGGERRSCANDIKVGSKVMLPEITRYIEYDPFLEFDGQKYIVCQTYELRGYLE